ncbi:microcystin-dependent protein [Agrobacterium tumefaciens]|uniref:hypothetical protein n=1 Tax=Agrobacterium tumefaciens TaxID=358 RepID=UPI001AE5AB66|nr:hypothetical protein [Agrobacterium tumefaciens]MBP2540048.1 microcystin-dependent protein [Agrobacterium tumefaciens]
MAGFWAQSLTQIHDPNGRPYIGARAYFFKGGTTTPITVYKSFDLGTINAHPNPLLTDGNGFWPPVYMDEANEFFGIRITTAQGVIILNADGIPIIGPATEGGGGGGTPTPVDPDSVFKTGDIKVRYGEGYLVGWVRANGRSIGSAVSGASERAHSDTQALYEFLWGVDGDLVVIGGRGASALADWNANKPLTLPDARGRALIGVDNMGNIAAGNVPAADNLGWTGGASTHVLALSEMPSHAHGLYDPGHKHSIDPARSQAGPVTTGGSGGANMGFVNETNLAYTGIAMEATGGGLAHNNVQPSIASTFYIRL